MSSPAGPVDPRVARTRDAVLDAAADVLVERGWAGLTIDAVARRSGVARTTIYRHWGSLSELVVDAVSCLRHEAEQPDTGSVRDDLVEKLGHLAAKLRHERWGQVLPALVAAAPRDAELDRRLRAMMADRRAEVAAMVRRGIERGELPADLDVEGILDRLAGPVFYRHLVLREDTDAAYLARLVDDVLAPARAPIAS